MVMSLAYDEDDVYAIPCMKCSLRGGRRADYTPARLPQVALQALEESPRGVTGRNVPRGRGRAAILKDRARKARERRSLASTQDDSSSIASSRLGFALGDELSEDGSEVTFPLRSQSSTKSKSSDVYESEKNSSPSSLNPTATQWPQSPSSPICETASQGSHYDVHVSQAEEKQLNIGCKQGRSKKTKFVPLDMRPAYEEYQSELLEGIPAGSEKSFFGGFDCFNLGSDQTRCFVPGYRPQKQPKVFSTVDFPTLPKDRTLKEEVNIMDSGTKKVQNMKFIASLITNPQEHKEHAPLDIQEAGTDEYEKAGCVLIMENVPEAVSRRDLNDYIEAYGNVSKITMQQTGSTYTARIVMVDESQAQWVADILDDSDSLIPAGEDGLPLKVHLMV